MRDGGVGDAGLPALFVDFVQCDLPRSSLGHRSGKALRSAHSDPALWLLCKRVALESVWHKPANKFQPLLELGVVRQVVATKSNRHVPIQIDKSGAIFRAKARCDRFFSGDALCSKRLDDALVYSTGRRPFSLDAPPQGPDVGFVLRGGDQPLLADGRAGIAADGRHRRRVIEADAGAIEVDDDDGRGVQPELRDRRAGSDVRG